MGLSALVMTCLPKHCFGSIAAFDSAADPAYNSGWAEGSNGGFGWGGGWQLRVNGIGSHFIGSSVTNGSGDPQGDGDINTPHSPSGRAWGLRAGFPDSAGGDSVAIRPFAGALEVGQVVRTDLDNGTVAPGGVVQFALLSSDGLTQFRLADEPGTADYLLEDGPGGNTVRHTGVLVSDQGLHIETKLTGPTSYSISLTPLVPGAQTTALTGDLIFPGVPTDRLGFISHQGGDDPAHAVYLNSIEVVPEPVTLGSSLVASMLVLSSRTRRRSGCRSAI
jgi:hypothetical protein